MPIIVKFKTAVSGMDESISAIVHLSGEEDAIESALEIILNALPCGVEYRQEKLRELCSTNGIENLKKFSFLKNEYIVSQIFSFDSLTEISEAEYDIIYKYADALSVVI